MSSGDKTVTTSIDVETVCHDVPGEDDCCSLTGADKSVIKQDESETGKSMKHSKDKRYIQVYQASI